VKSTSIRARSSKRCAEAPPAAPGFAAGTLEALKWLALVAMTLDHANAYLWHDGWPGLHALGRIAMPLFAFVLACRLASPGARVRGVHLRVMLRLGVAGACAAFVLALLGVLEHGWWPLNILFTLMAGTGVTWLIESEWRWGSGAALVLAFVAGALVEYWWFGLAFFVAAWWYCRRPDVARLLVLVAACASLAAVNGSHCALLALPLLGVARCCALPVPRLRHVFYAYYPAHLALLLVLR
jgi:hypothetical protein